MANQGKLLELKRCPHCSVDCPHLRYMDECMTKDHTEIFQRIWVMYACTRCGGVITACSEEGSPYIVEMHPKSLEVEEAIPDRAREYLEQAISSISAPAGAIMLAASSVDAMLKEKGLNSGKLYSRINLAVEEHLITKEMSEWAHEVRLDANNQRHSDNSSTLPTSDDAKKAIDFVQALGTFLFVLPARVKRGLANAKSS